MITPAIHKTLPQIRDVLAREAGHDLPVDREALTAWARERLRAEFLRAEIGITGVNFAAADTGTLVLVTNEGNGRFCTTLPARAHRGDADREGRCRACADIAVLAAAADHARDRPGALELRHDDLGAAPRGRGRRAGGVARRLPRQSPPHAARHAVRGDARVHPLRRVPERVPRLPECERPRVRRGLLGPDGQGAHAAAVRAGRRAPTSPTVRRCATRARRVPGGDPARRHDRRSSAPRGRRTSVTRRGGGLWTCVGAHVGVAAWVPAHRPRCARRLVARSGCRGAGHVHRALPRSPRRRSGAVGEGDADDRRRSSPGCARTLHGDGSAGACRRAPQSSSRTPRPRGVQRRRTDPGLVARSDGVLTPADSRLGARLVDADVGITGARVAMAEPAAIALAAATRFATRDEPGSARTHMRGARRRHRRDARRRDRPHRGRRVTERAHLDRRPEPDRRPRDDPDARRARPRTLDVVLRSEVVDCVDGSGVAGSEGASADGDRCGPVRRRDRLPSGRRPGHADRHHGRVLLDHGARVPGAADARTSSCSCALPPSSDGNGTLETVFVRDNGEEIGPEPPDVLRRSREVRLPTGARASWSSPNRARSRPAAGSSRAARPSLSRSPPCRPCHDRNEANCRAQPGPSLRRRSEGMDLVNRYAAALSLHPTPVEAVGEVAGEILERFDGTSARPARLLRIAAPRRARSRTSSVGSASARARRT